MAKEEMKLGEDFSATVKKAGNPAGIAAPLLPPPPVPAIRHRVIGWGVLAAIVGALLWWFVGSGSGHDAPATLQETPGLTETLGRKLGGVLTLRQIRAGTVIHEWGPFHNTIVNAGETALRDCFNNNSGTECTDVIALLKFHGLGTSSAAIAETQTGCQAELTTQYAVDNTRPTGSQTTNGANVYRTVGVNTVDAGAVIEEFCLNNLATGAGIMWTRILTGTVTLAASDSLTTTYDLTIE